MLFFLLGNTSENNGSIIHKNVCLTFLKKLPSCFLKLYHLIVPQRNDENSLPAMSSSKLDDQFKFLAFVIVM